MREARTKEIRIEAINGDIDDVTVDRFLEFAYKGKYKIPKPATLSSSNAPVETDSGELRWPSKILDIAENVSKSDASFLGMYRMVKDFDEHANKRIVERRRKKLSSSFLSKVNVQYRTSWKPCPNTNPKEDHREILFCHVRLYILANRYQCQELLKICCQKLRWKLAHFTLHKSSITGFIDMTQYAYDHTPSLDNSIDELRELLAEYMVCHAEELARYSMFSDLLNNNGEIEHDLVIHLLVSWKPKVQVTDF